MDTLSPGKRLGTFEVLGLIAGGGMGEVYRARDLRLGREVALKVLGASSLNAESRRLVREARAASALNHPNIVIVYELGEEDGRWYMAMELVTGEPVAALIPPGGMESPRALQIAQQLASALEAAHGAGVIHRDVKPSNILITPAGVVKVLDFGLAKRTYRPGETDTTESVSTVTEPGTVIGTVAYMSPEQAEGGPVDARTDIFSFGAVLYEMLAGKPAFGGTSAASTLLAIMKEEPPRLREVAPDVPPALERVVRRCIRKPPGDRFQSFGEIRTALGALKFDDRGGLLRRLRSSLPGFGRTR